MKSSLRGVIRNLDAGPEAHEVVQRAPLSRPRVNTRDYAHLPAPKEEALEFRSNEANAGKSDKRTEEINTISALYFEGYLRSDLQIFVPVDEKRAVSKRDPSSRRRVLH